MLKFISIVLAMVIVLGLAGCVAKGQRDIIQVTPPSLQAPGESINILSTENRQFNGIWVTGEGKAFATPDIALLGLAIETQSKSVGEAQSQARQAMARVRQALAQSGIEEKDIRTTSYSIQPLYRWIQAENRQELTGYRVSDRMSVKVRKIPDAGKIIDASVEAGGNFVRVDSISFTIDDPTLYKNEAREKAVKDAMARARQMTEVAGVKMGKALYIKESSVFIHPTRPLSAPLPLAARAEAIAPTEISPGETEIQVQVQINFAIE